MRRPCKKLDDTVLQHLTERGRLPASSLRVHIVPTRGRAARARVPGMGMNYRDERFPTELMEVTVAELQGHSREARAERSRRQTCDRRNTNGQRGRVRATSWRATAKSKVDQGASGRVRRRAGKVHVLTRGDLHWESGGEVSRDRSSDEAGESRWSEGLKNRKQ